ncbi:MAG: phosphoribosylformylglycinamidine cyclo-ligase [Desulfatibacillaceae bacterium]
MKKPLTYADAGVDIDKGNELVDVIKKIAKNTPRSGVMGDIGGFGGLFSLNTDRYDRPVLVASTDGVGTKLKVAHMCGKHDTVGIDLVAMSVNDIACQGARPLFFLDYLSMGRLDTDVAAQVIEGIAEGCRQAQCALLGGETAEMPGMYAEGEYDLAGFAVGIVDNASIVDGSEVGVGNKLIAVASSGLHSNGYSLARKVFFEVLGLDVDSWVEDLGRTVGEELLVPTRIYAETVKNLARNVQILGIANITGGGIIHNLPRTIPNSCKAVVNINGWETPPVFSLLRQAANIPDQEMLTTFNNGVGLILVVPENVVVDAMEMLRAMDEKAWVIGEIEERGRDEPHIQWR